MKRHRLLLPPLLVLGMGCAASDSPESGSAPPDTAIDIVLGLARDQGGLEDFAVDVNDPNSPTYGQFIEVSDVAAQFGADDEVSAAVQSFFDERGGTVRFNPAGGTAVVSLSVGQATEIFETGWNAGTTGSGVPFIQPLGDATVPSELDGVVAEVVATAERLDAGDDVPRPAATGGEDQAACAAASTTVERTHQLYGISALSAMGLDGSAMSVAVVSIGSFDSYAYSLWTTCLGLDPVVQPTELLVDVARGLDQEGEVDLDIDTIVAITPNLAALDVVTVDEFGWVGTPFAAALDGDIEMLPDVISSSIGFCESQLDAASIELTEYSLAALAAVGSTVIATSGDFGSTACGGDELSVQYPGTSAYVTTVGGTQLDSDGVSQTTWADATGTATGGGTSAIVDRPSYQLEDGEGREVPDLALLASGADLPPIPICSAQACRWQNVGGTSAAGPLFAASVAQIKQMMAQEGSVPVGMLNPLLYAVASEPGSFVDIVSGSNDVAGLGCCDAGDGFDLATGWGAPDIAALADAAFAAAPDANS